MPETKKGVTTHIEVLMPREAMADRCAHSRSCAYKAAENTAIRISLTLIDWRQHPEREQRIRDLFTRNGIAPAGMTAETDSDVSAARLGAARCFLCSEVLASG